MVHVFQFEVDICRKENPFEIRLRKDSTAESHDVTMELDSVTQDTSDEHEVNEGASTSTEPPQTRPTPRLSAPKYGTQCYPQRAALLKSMLNFLKKATPDPSFSEGLRHCK